MKNSSQKPTIGITMGDPVGIGPEIIVKALEENSVWDACLPFVLGDREVMDKTLKFLGSALELRPVKEIKQDNKKEKVINVLALSKLNPDQIFFGKPNRDTGEAMVGYIKKAIHLVLEKKIDGMVTCPINKAAMSLAGYTYPGHTELLVEETNTKEYAMMLAGKRLKVVLVTIHLPLRKVSEVLSSEKVFSCIRLTHNYLKKFFGIKKPRLAVAALNPHAGEGGLFGEEEEKIIDPMIKKAREEGINVLGPFAPDTLFYFAIKGHYDAVICMYHDQGLIPLKLLHFEDAVNVTLGIPIIRTSVDHGTAYDIAGSGRASPKSLINAIKLAAQMAFLGKNSVGQF
ncbi:MAG: 4-hydroxythreonine-4-phosphate dehydrogenase PdxA [Thermodesulfobacteriota bacterium]|jgi:4-hydroxythreonine-4-phosphate dehydrogenase|nr:MAG: 4-hydroxythreonine-4-phosphate dehydrogenase PdxA [Thermodesulfobacteriota bacterium]